MLESLCQSRSLDVLVVGQNDNILLKGKLAIHVKTKMSILFNSVITLLVTYNKEISSKVSQYMHRDFNIYNKQEKSCLNIYPLPRLFSGH